MTTRTCRIISDFGIVFGALVRIHPLVTWRESLTSSKADSQASVLVQERFTKRVYVPVPMHQSKHSKHDLFYYFIILLYFRHKTHTKRCQHNSKTANPTTEKKVTKRQKQKNKTNFSDLSKNLNIIICVLFRITHSKFKLCIIEIRSRSLSNKQTRKAQQD